MRAPTRAHTRPRAAFPQAEASGEAGWIAPGLERRLKPKHKKEKKEKKEKKKKSKHSSHRKEGAPAPTGAASGSDSSSDDDDDEGTGGGGSATGAVGAAGGEEAAAPPAIAPAGAGGTKARAAAGLDWMMRPPPRVDAKGEEVAPAPPPQDAAAVEAVAAAHARITRELNPYAAEGREVNEWPHATHGEAGTAATAARGRGLGDGGQSFLLKKMSRAVEEAEQNARPLDEVCHERFGSLELLPKLQAMAAGERAASGGKGGGANARAHLRALRRAESAA